MNPKNWQWSWIFWQVAAPIFGPIIISAIVVFAWQTGDPNFRIDWLIVLDDISPWALTFYCITLIGATMNGVWPKLATHPGLGVSLIVAALAVALYRFLYRNMATQS